jgi:hypothetical protein
VEEALRGDERTGSSVLAASCLLFLSAAIPLALQRWCKARLTSGVHLVGRSVSQARGLTGGVPVHLDVGGSGSYARVG